MERGAVKGLPYLLCSGILRLAARLIVEVREEGVSGWQGKLIDLVSCIEVLGGEDALALLHVEVWVCCHIDLEGNPKVLEDVLHRSDQIAGQGLERAGKELQAVLEHQVLAPAQRQVLLHSVTDGVYVEPRELSEAPTLSGANRIRGSCGRRRAPWTSSSTSDCTALVLHPGSRPAGAPDHAPCPC